MGDQVQFCIGRRSRPMNPDEYNKRQQELSEQWDKLDQQKADLDRQRDYEQKELRLELKRQEMTLGLELEQMRLEQELEQMELKQKHEQQRWELEQGSESKP